MCCFWCATGARLFMYEEILMSYLDSMDCLSNEEAMQKKNVEMVCLIFLGTFACILSLFLHVFNGEVNELLLFFNQAWSQIKEAYQAVLAGHNSTSHHHHL